MADPQEGSDIGHVYAKAEAQTYLGPVAVVLPLANHCPLYTDSLCTFIPLS